MHTVKREAPTCCITSTIFWKGTTISSVTQLCQTLCYLINWSMPGFSVLHQLLELAQTHVHQLSNAIEPSQLLSSPSPPALSLSQHQGLFKWVISNNNNNNNNKINESVLHIRWPEYWSFSFSISPSNEYSGLISLRIDWFDLLAAQGRLKSLLQHHNSKAVNSLAFRFLYSQTLTSIHDYWKNHSFNYTDLC